MKLNLDKLHADRLLTAVDMAGTFVFGLEGALAAMHGGLDLLGVMVLGFTTALGGGIIRDVLIGAVPPAAIREWHYGAVAFLGAACAFFLKPLGQDIPAHLLLVLDAAGLGLFAVAGAGKALSFQINPFVSILMGGITGVGGGTVRDVLLNHVPTVLRADIYATAALLGAAIMVIGIRLKQNPVWMSVIGGVACFLLRLVSAWEHWNLPTAGG